MAVKDTSKRNFLKIGSAAAVAAAVAGVGGYYAWETFKPKEIAREEPIPIGLQCELTGWIAFFGYWLHKTMVATVNKINAEGGVAGRPLELFVEDTQTDPALGPRKFRKLCLEHAPVAVIGSVFGGLVMPTVPIAQELKTLYMPIDMTYEATAEQGNRYMYRIITQVRSQVEMMIEWAMDAMGPNWAVVVQDQAWGWSHREQWEKACVENGGKITAAMNTPIGTKDFIPYLSKIPKDTDGIYYCMTGADTIGFLTQTRELGIKAKKVVVVCCVDGMDVSQLGDAVEGDYILEYLPRRLEYKDTKWNRQMRDLVGMDEEGFEVDNPENVNVGSHYWGVYEQLYFLKECIEKSGWQSKKDDPELIETMEKTEHLKESEQYPQGDAFVRGSDHQGFFENWMSQVINGKLEVQFSLPKEESVYPTPVDYREWEF